MIIRQNDGISKVITLHIRANDKPNITETTGKK